jgi:argininosuccinate lyase
MKKRRVDRFPHPVYLRTVLKPNFDHSVSHLFSPLLQVNRAHAIMLGHCGIVKKPVARLILRALGKLESEQALLKRYDFRGQEEDLFFYVEKQLEKLCGPDNSGHLSVARSRNDIDMTLYRMVLRDELLKTASLVSALRRAALDVAAQHTLTIMPVVTHTQLAQPTTLAHYLLAAAEFLDRDFSRLKESFLRVNQCPLGACVATTTGFPIDRRMLSQLLGFETVLENAYGCIASVDYLVESVGVLSALLINLGRFVQDLLLWSSQDVGLIHLPDGFVQTSSIMPQKRNPVALEHLRILASNGVGQCQSVILGLHNTPFGDIVDTEDDLQPVIRTAFDYTARVLELLTAALQSITVNSAAALQKCQGGGITLTELADWLVRTHDLPFRTSHRIVSQIVGELRRNPARRQGESHAERVSLLLEKISQEVLGKPIRLPPQDVSLVLDPFHFVRVRKILGGPAPGVVRRSIDRHQKLLTRQEMWLREKQKLLSSYSSRLKNL